MIVCSKKLLLALPIIFGLLALLVLLIHVCHEGNYKEMYEELLLKQPPEIISIQFDDVVVKNQGHGWVELKNRARIKVSLNGPATLVELYIVPTGTSTYKEQQLIDCAYPENGVAEYVWDVPDNTMGHFWVVAYQRYAGRRSFAVNVIRQELQ